MQQKCNEYYGDLSLAIAIVTREGSAAGAEMARGWLDSGGRIDFVFFHGRGLHALAGGEARASWLAFGVPLLACAAAADRRGLRIESPIQLGSLSQWYQRSAAAHRVVVV